MPFTFTPNRARPPEGEAESQRSTTMGLSFNGFLWWPHSPLRPPGSFSSAAFSRLGLIAVFALVYFVGTRANSPHTANINHANHKLLFTQRWNAALVSTSAARVICVHVIESCSGVICQSFFSQFSSKIFGLRRVRVCTSHLDFWFHSSRRPKAKNGMKFTSMTEQ